MKLNNKTIRTAVSAWLKSPESAKKKYGHISDWDTSEVTDMSKLFLNAHSFNEAIGSWDVSNVTNMRAMFDNAVNFNQPLEKWNTSNVEDISEMFSSTSPTAFNQPIGNWDVSKVKDFNHIFFNASNFNQDIGAWDTSSVKSMCGAFSHAKKFNQPIGCWNVSNVENMSMMFKNALNFNQPLDNWDTSSVEDMHYMFSGAKKFNQPLNSWNTKSVKDMRGMFYLTSEFNQPLDKWNLKNVVNIRNMFNRALTFNQPLNSWCIDNVNNMVGLFELAKDFNQPLDKWNVSKCEDFTYMFYGAEKFNQLLGSWKIGEKGQANFDGFLTGAISFDQDIWEWIQKYNCGWAEVDPFKNVKSIGRPSEKKNKKIISISAKKRAALVDRLKVFTELRVKNVDFSILELRVGHGWDYDEHPAIRNENEILSFHSDYDYSVENIDCYAVAPSCFYKIQMNDEVFHFVYMNVGIDDSYNSDRAFWGILPSNWSYSEDWYRTNVLWNHESDTIQNEDIAWSSIGKLGSILSNEEVSWENFDFFEDLPNDSENIEYGWEELKDDMDLIDEGIL